MHESLELNPAKPNKTPPPKVVMPAKAGIHIPESAPTKLRLNQLRHCEQSEAISPELNSTQTSKTPPPKVVMPVNTGIHAKKTMRSITYS